MDRGYIYFFVAALYARLSCQDSDPNPLAMALERFVYDAS